MANKQIIVSLPETLLERANAAHLDIESILLKALETTLRHPVSSELESEANETYLLSLIASDRQEAAKQTLAQGKRILGLFEEQGGWIADDFTATLADDFWGDLYQ